jgi:hypothetical protein
MHTNPGIICYNNSTIFKFLEKHRKLLNYYNTCSNSNRKTETMTKTRRIKAELIQGDERILHPELYKLNTYISLQDKKKVTEMQTMY